MGDARACTRTTTRAPELTIVAAVAHFSGLPILGLLRLAKRTRMYSVRFFVGFLGAAAAAPVVAWLHERTGSLAAATLAMAGFGVVTLGCALAFPDRREELQPELWGDGAAVPAE